MAILMGNLLYFSLLPFLPRAVRHEPFHIDWGLGVDFWFCFGFYGLLSVFKWFRPR